MPQVAVYGLTISQAGHLLYAATHGRGAYRLALPVKPGTPPAGGGSPGGGSPPPGSTPPPATTDKIRPTLTVSKIKSVRRPKRTTIKGRARDASKIRRVTLRFGDGKRKRTVKLTSSGRFTVRHRYTKPARYEVTVTATDRAGNSRTRHRTARVRSRPAQG